MVSVDWIEEAQKNNGILPDSFSGEKGLSDDSNLAYNLWINTYKVENLSKFSKAALTEVLRTDPTIMSPLAQSGIFDKESLTNISLEVPVALEYAPDSIVLDTISRKPDAIAFISEAFIRREYKTILPYLTDNPELLANRHVPLTLKEKPEVSSLIKDMLTDKIPTTEENLKKLLSRLPERLENDKELFRYLLEKDPGSYRYSGQEIRNDLNLTNLTVSKDPKQVILVGDKLLQDNPAINTLYFMQNPEQFSHHKFAPKDTQNTRLLEIILRSDFSNYKLLEGSALETPVAKKVEFGLQRLEQVQKGAKDNPNLTYDLVSNKEIMQLPPEVLKSFLEYDTKSVQAVTEISGQGKLENLKNFIHWTFGNAGKNQRSAYNAILGYQSVSDIVQNVDLSGLSFDENNTFKHIVATKNPYGIKTEQELKEYPQRLKDECLKQTDLAGMKNKIFQVLGYTPDDLTKLKESFPQLADHFPTIKFLDHVVDAENITLLKARVLQTDFNKVLRAPSTLHQQFAHAYENEYRQSCLNLSDAETTSIQSGVEIKDLGKKPFKMFMHRIFNFDPSLSENVKILIEHPEKWETLTGASYISTSFISEKSIKGVFRGLKGGPELMLLGPETIETLQTRVDQYEKEKDNLEKIDPTAVFLGFSEIPEGSLLSMAPMDMMTEHGGKHATVKTDLCRFYSPDDLAYTTTGAWNEVAITREDPQTSKRIMPTCVICFDQQINPESLHFAQTLNLPIVNINRADYAELNRKEQEKSKKEFKQTLSLSSLKKLFYSTKMTDMVDFQAQEILKMIDINQSASQDDKLKALSFLDEQFHRLISATALSPDRYSPKIRLEKLKGTYISDGDKIDNILSNIKKSVERISPANSSLLSRASQKEMAAEPSSGTEKLLPEQVRKSKMTQPPSTLPDR